MMNNESILFLRDISSSSIAGVVTVIVMTPLDTCRTRLQVSKERTSGIRLFSSILKEEGPRALYKGMSAPLCAQAVYKMVMFSSFGLSSRAFEARQFSPSSFPIGFLCGAFAGFLNSFVVAPVELVRNNLAIQKGFVNLKYSGPQAVIKDVYCSEGMKGMFRGLYATFLRDIPGVGAYFGAFHFSKEHLKHIVPTYLVVPISGALAGISYWTLILPADAVKTIVQTSKMNIQQALRVISLSHIYGTVYPMALARGIPGASITFSVQSHASKWIEENIV